MAEQRLWIDVAGSSGRSRELPRTGLLVIGSDPARAALVVTAGGVDGAHCAVGKLKDGGFGLRDLGSASGTYVNGERIGTARLQDGDRITIGAGELRVLGAPSSSAPPARPALAPAAVSPAFPPDPAAMPARVAGYRVERELGRGAQGQVYLALQESLDRRVALKVLDARHATDADFVRRFQAEARAAAALNHPNVVVVFDVGFEDGRHYLSMEYMERGSLQERLATGGRFPADEVRAILRDAARGLVYAEERGIVHRDIKPANLMQNAAGATKIADLGLATTRETEAAIEGGRKVFGTPHFISPEQARGEAVDCRSDLYSLGATAYRLLTGRTPFEGASTREILRAVFTQEPRKVRELVPDAPEQLAALIERLLAKRPDDRFASARALIEALDEMEAERGAHLSGAGAARRRHPMRVALLVLAVGGAIAWFAWPRERGASPSDPPERSPAPLAAPTPEATPPVPTYAAGDPRLRELEAENALLRARGVADPAARHQALVELAETYAGSDAAARASDEAVALGQEIEQAAQAARARSAALAAARAALHSRPELAQAATAPAAALAAVSAAAPPPGLDGDPAWQEELARTRSEIAETARARAVDTIARAREAEDAGQFDQARAEYDSLPRSESFGAEQEDPSLALLTSVLVDAEQRRADLDALARRFAAERAHADALAFSRAFRGAAQGDPCVRTDLAELALRGAAERCDELAGELWDPAQRERARAFAAEFRGAQAALDALAAEFERGWRRRSIGDPRPRASGQVEIAGIGAEGLELGSADARERVPWAALAARPEVLHQLFVGRLARDYSAGELAGIAALLRVSAVLGALEALERGFDPERRSGLRDDAVADALAGFARADDWAEQHRVAARPGGPGGSGATSSTGGEPARTAAERAAIECVAAALGELAREQWALAALDLERALTVHAPTLAVGLLSDGSERPVPIAGGSAAGVPSSSPAPADGATPRRGG